jgi:hypothetical protein
MKTVIFVGPSISRQKLQHITEAELAPPIRRGDLTRFPDYDRFIIIDGEFGQSLSVSPKEILGLLDQGKTVLGAASMGALRASELDIHGMTEWVGSTGDSRPQRFGETTTLPWRFRPSTSPLLLCRWSTSSTG